MLLFVGGGYINNKLISKMVLNDWQRGCFLYFVKPPVKEVSFFFVSWGSIYQL